MEILGTAPCHAAEPFLWSLVFGLLVFREILLHESNKIFVKHAQDVAKIWFRTWGLFLESLDNFSGSESFFVFIVFAFKIKVSIILKIIQ